jgi:outer membrane protein TolC
MILCGLLLAAATTADDGTLRLTLADAVRLAMRSDAVRMERLSHETARLDVVTAKGRAYDPAVTSSFGSSHNTTPTIVTTDGAPILNEERDGASLRIEQRLPTGTRAELTVAGNRKATNADTATFNPSYGSSVQVAVTQPLLRNRTGLGVRGPVLLAEQNETASKASLDAALAAAVEDTVTLYWNTVLAVERLDVRRKSLALAETTHAKNRRMLELGAIAPLEIHRSESDVASRKLEVLSAEFEERRQMDELRRGLGLDADPATENVAIELLDRPGTTEPVDLQADTALEQALRVRPELLAIAARLDVDATQVRLAREDTRVGLDLRASYMAQGVAGTEFDLRQAPSSVLSQTRLDHAFGQVFDRQFPTWDVSVTLNLPTRNRAARATLASARVTQDRRRLELAELRRRIALEVRAAVDQVESARQSIELATVVRDHAQKTLEADRRKYELGTIELFFVLESQARLSQAELSVLQSRASYETARTHLDRVTGRLLGRYGISADENETAIE